MGLESATYISGLNAAWPIGAADPKAQGDDHLRLIKSTLQASFPNISGAMTVSHTALNALAAAVTGFAVPVNKVKGTGAAGAGVATTGIRSDAQLLIDLTDSFAWTGQNSWTVQLRALNGTVGAPAYSFTGQLTSGMYLASAGNLEFAVAGARALNLSNSRAYFEDGLVGTPSISFFSDADTGIYRAGANILGFSTGGAVAMSMNTAGIFPFLQIASAAAGGAGVPDYSFNGDADTGMYHVGADSIGLTAGGTVRVTIDSGAATFSEVLKTRDGVVGAPSYSFTSEPTTGFFRSAAGKINVAKTGADFGPLTGIYSAVKAATTSRNTTIVLANDPDLTLTLPVGTYSVELWAPVWGTTAGAQGINYAMAFSGTSTSAAFGTENSMAGGGNIVTTLTKALATAFSFAAISTGTGVAPADFVHVKGTITVSVAGALTFQWCQNSSSGNNTNVGIGAWMRAIRLA